MATFGGPRFPGIENGLVFAVDPLNQESWTGPDSAVVNNIPPLSSTISGSIYNDTSGSLGVLNDSGVRVICPDLIGYGKSDKPAKREDYSYQNQVDWMNQWLVKNNLDELTFFGQDWGGLVGLRVVGELPDRFSHVVVSNTGMVARSGITAWLFEKFVQFRVWWIGPITFEELMAKAKDALTVENPSPFVGLSMFSNWIAYSYYAEDMNITGIIENFGRLDLSEKEAYAYEAPYPSGLYKAGAHVWPYLIPTQLPENEKLWKEVYEKWDKPFLVAFGENERITLPMKADFLERIPNPTVITLGGASHFVQEEVGPELAQIISDFIQGKPVADLPAKN